MRSTELSTQSYYILLTLAERPSIGYRMINRIKELSYGSIDLKTGTMYPALRTLVYKRLVEHHVLYEITPNGRIALAQQVTMYKQALKAAKVSRAYYQDKT